MTSPERGLQALAEKLTSHVGEGLSPKGSASSRQSSSEA